MIYSIGTNFSKDLIENIAKMDSENKIKAVFGKLQDDLIGGGRASALLPNISMDELKDYIQLCHSKQIEFNYLLNPMCLGNNEVDSQMHKEMLSHIDNLVNIGVDAFTVNSPYLCRVIKNRYPDKKVTVGLYAGVSTIRQIGYWYEMKADEITLTHNINRNFKLLEKMLKYTADKNISLRVIANNVCLKDCPFKVSHGTGQAHASQTQGNKIYFDLDLLSCTNKKINDPSKILSSDWIRPEDVKYYEKLCEKTNNHKFSLKLVERTKNTEFLTRVAGAYINESFDGNLLDILGWPEGKEANKIDYTKLLEEAKRLGYDKDTVFAYLKTLQLPHMYIDNKKLDGFLDKFIENNECDYKSCTNGDTCSENQCRYCYEWSKKCTSFDEDERNSWIEYTRELLKQFDTSKIFTNKI